MNSKVANSFTVKEPINSPFEIESIKKEVVETADGKTSSYDIGENYKVGVGKN